MNFAFRGIIATILTIGIATAAHADGVVVEANGARAHGVWGGELGVGYAFEVSGFTLRPMVGGFVYKGDNDRYYKDQLSNGQTRCRDSQTGYFTKDVKCDNTAVKAYGKIEATYTFPMFAEVGAGARFSGDKVRPYGTASFAVAPKIRVKGNIGDQYYALGLRADF